MSLPSTPVFMEGQTSPFFGPSGSSSKARGKHPGFESAALEGERDRSAALALNGNNGIGYETESLDPYDKQLMTSAGPLTSSSLDIDPSALMDPYPSSSSPTARNNHDLLDSNELTELDAFAAHMLSTDVPMELSQPELMPKYSKKRAAVKKSSKTTTASTDGKAAGESHEEVIFIAQGVFLHDKVIIQYCLVY